MKLARLISELGISRNELLNQLVIEHGVSLPEEAPAPTRPIPDIHQIAKKGAPPQMRVLTREEREAKIAAAQSWLAKGKK